MAIPEMLIKAFQGLLLTVIKAPELYALLILMAWLGSKPNGQLRPNVED